MHDFDPFERRLAAALRADADLGFAGFDPSQVAQAAIAHAPRRQFRVRLGTAPAVRRPGMVVVYVLVTLALVLALVVGAIVAGAFRTRPVVPSGWAPTSGMTEARVWHTATLLPDGTVLVVGGSSGSDSVESAELYDPATGSWAAVGSMAGDRQDHTATLLADGKVLVAGGRDNQGAPLASAELYDPKAGSWAAMGSMAGARALHTATLLSDGRVLVAGGSGSRPSELYDPTSGTWALTGAMIAGRTGHTATLLRDGRVLVVGGFGGDHVASAEVYDPSSGSWTAAGNLHEPRAGHTAMLLPDGRVLVAGGSNADDSFHPTASAELYDPGTGSWVATGSMTAARVYAAATLLPDGTVLIAGGSSRTSNTDSGPPGPAAPAELYHPDSGSWTATTRMTETRVYPTATLLKDGTVLVTGGNTKPVLGSALASAERYGPEGGTR